VELVAGGEQAPEFGVVFDRFEIFFEGDGDDDFSCP